MGNGRIGNARGASSSRSHERSSALSSELGATDTPSSPSSTSILTGIASEEPGSFKLPGVRRPDSSWAPSGVWSPDEYADIAANAFANAPLFQGKGFYEVEAARRVERYDRLAHVWSTYESRLAPDEEPFARGINSFQLYHDGERWWVMSILWEQESPAAPIPQPYLPE